MTGKGLKLFLGGDLMTGRGIDQILPHPSPPDLYERWVQHAEDYVTLAVRRNGPIPRPVPFHYIWGDALAELERQRPQLRLVNLETSVTRSARYQPDKGIHYRMNPANVPCLTAAAIDCCVLANNHVLDWGEDGLVETLDVLERSSIAVAGAGRSAEAASQPAILAAGPAGRLLVFAFGLASSGIPATWAAKHEGPGINHLPDCSTAGAERVVAAVNAHRREGDLVLVSIHWGGNWGYDIPPEHVEFAHRLVDEAGANVVHGHSSHHPMAVEVYRGRPVLYGCGDLLNDYEGIRGYEAFRSELTFMYFPMLDPTKGSLLELVLTPMQIRRLRLEHCSEEDARWLAERMREQGSRFGTGVRERDGRLHLEW